MKGTSIVLLLILLLSANFAGASTIVPEPTLTPASYTHPCIDLDNDHKSGNFKPEVHFKLPVSKIIPDLFFNANNLFRRARFINTSIQYPLKNNSLNLSYSSSDTVNDATTLFSPASYSFSLTDFHRFLFRLTPF
jgi:hypothetical protein